jgi:hypothetical protein
VDHFQVREKPGANPTIVSYNASIVKINNATGSQVRFENKCIFFYFIKCSSPLLRWRCGCKFKSHRIVSSHLLFKCTFGFANQRYFNFRNYLHFIATNKYIFYAVFSTFDLPGVGVYWGGMGLQKFRS